VFSIVVNEFDWKTEVYEVNFLRIVEPDYHIFKFEVVMDVVQRMQLLQTLQKLNTDCQSRRFTEIFGWTLIL